MFACWFLHITTLSHHHPISTYPILPACPTLIQSGVEVYVDDYSTVPDVYPRALWRVIIHRPADGAMNMAIDEAITEGVRDGRVPPTLRFYAWEPACLSLGYAQPVSDVDFSCLAARGWEVVRRLTGGRAILHTDELTYSIAVPIDEPRVAGGVVESYRRLSRGLMLGLDQLHAPVQSNKSADGARGFKGPVCFEVPSDYEITANGRKLLGSAQTRRGEVVLQHGALPLTGDLSRICDVLSFESEMDRGKAKQRVLARAITLEEALGRRISMARAVGALMTGFAEALNLEFEEASLSEMEMARAEELRATKYTTKEWTHRH
jgi:lipoate-protein ligase A